jgi:hypothetical protein
MQNISRPVLKSEMTTYLFEIENAYIIIYLLLYVAYKYEKAYPLLDINYNNLSVRFLQKTHISFSNKSGPFYFSSNALYS